MKRFVWLAIGVCGLLLAMAAQDLRVVLEGGKRPALAVPDFKGAGGAAPFMAAFNETLANDLEGSGLFKMVSKSMMPLDVPQQPSDLREPPPPQSESARRGRRREPPQPQSGNGRWLSDWSSPPVNANYLALGYAAQQNDVFLLQGWLLNLGRENVSAAQMLGKRYFGSLDEKGARQTAHEFAADIMGQFGGQSLLNTKIYFVSDRTGRGIKEIWSMDPDGSNQKQITRFRSICNFPAVSPDGTKIAFTSWAHTNPGIFVFTAEGRRLPFYNQPAPTNGTPSFTLDGKQIVYSSSATGTPQIYICNVDGRDLRRVTNSPGSIDVEPKVNPKTGADMVFVRGYPGTSPQQIYHMNMDGTNVERLTPGEGEASNPSWHPDGQLIAYAWTRGFATGNFNIFVMDVATRKYNQLTYGAGRNENPSWAPDGRHLVFCSTRNGRRQVWTMLGDGTQLRQLTTQGNNETPVWGKSGL